MVDPVVVEVGETVDDAPAQRDEMLQRVRALHARARHQMVQVLAHALSDDDAKLFAPLHVLWIQNSDVRSPKPKTSSS